MHVPRHFAMPDDCVRALLDGVRAAELVTATPDGPVATLLPLLHADGALLGHLARSNPQWQQPVLGEALVIVRGADAYVSPGWYPSKDEHGRVVPTWDYETVHAYGHLVVHDDPAWCEDLVRRLTERHEGGRPRPWSVDDAPPAYVAGQLRAVVGVEVVLTRVEAKAKLSQNRPAADVDGVVAGLRGDGEHAVADAVEAARR